MPRKPVATRSQGSLGSRGAAVPSGDAAVGAKTRSAVTAQSRFSAAQTAAVRPSPSEGTSTNVEPRTPSSAPNVLPAYSAATLPRSSPARSARSSAGSVAPIAAVAGNRTTNVPEKASSQWATGDGRAPISRSNTSVAGTQSQANARLQAPISVSQAAYQRSGRALSSIVGARHSAPRPRPPKKAATTASTAADSCPSQSAACSVQTI